MRREANFQTKFRHYILANPPSSPTHYELKQTTTNSLPFSSVKQHQIDWLLATKHNHTLYKPPDDSMGYKPCDYIYSTSSKAYIVIKYPSFFCFIDIDTFVCEANKSKRKSLTAERARQIADKVV